MWVEGFPNYLYFSLFCSCEGSVYPNKISHIQKNSEQSQEIVWSLVKNKPFCPKCPAKDSRIQSRWNLCSSCLRVKISGQVLKTRLILIMSFLAQKKPIIFFSICYTCLLCLRVGMNSFAGCQMFSNSNGFQF